MKDFVTGFGLLNASNRATLGDTVTESQATPQGKTILASAIHDASYDGTIEARKFYATLAMSLKKTRLDENKKEKNNKKIEAAQARCAEATGPA